MQKPRDQGTVPSNMDPSPLKLVPSAPKIPFWKRGIVSVILKITFVTGLLALLVKNGAISASATREALGQSREMTLAFVFVAVNTFLGMVRWYYLVRAQNIPITFKKTSELTLIGAFFNIALPGAITGDVVKAFYVGKLPGARPSIALGSIIFDRIAGVSALILVSAAGFAMGNDHLGEGTLAKSIHIFVAASSTFIFGFYAYIFSVKEHWDPLLRVLNRLNERWPRAGSLHRVYLGIRAFHDHRAAVVGSVALSVVIHFLICAMVYQFVKALGLATIPYEALLIIVPLGFLVTAVPLAPAGVGTGHAAFLILFRLVGTERGADLYTLCTLANIALGIAGSFFYLKYRANTPSGPVA